MKWFCVEYYSGQGFYEQFLRSKAYINTETITHITACELGINTHIVIGFGDKELVLTDESTDSLLPHIGLSREDVLYQGTSAFK